MIKYTNTSKISAQQLASLFKSSGIRRPLDSQEQLTKMIENASILWTAWDNNELVGVARALSDDSYVCYLSDLAVAKSYQHQGIGKKLVAHLQQQIGKDLTLVLFAAEGAMDYYPKLGFKNVDNGFMILGKRAH